MGSQPSPQIFKVIIIGGGSTGLAIAQGLAKARIFYTVYERSPSTSRPRDWGMLLHWGTSHLLSVLPPHLQARLSETWVDPRYDWSEPVVRMDGATGEITGRVPGKDLVRVSRRKLRDFLAQGVEIEYRKALKDVETVDGGIKVIFDDGTEAIGSMVIGADGARSRVRELLVGKEKAKCVDTGFTMINYCHAKYTTEQAKVLRSTHPILTTGLLKEARIVYLLAALDVSDADRPENWVFQNYMGWYSSPYKQDLQSTQDAVRFFKEKASKFCEPFYTASQGITDDAVLPVDAGHQWSPSTWNNRNGRMSLAGDAAHAMLPHRGQGLNNAMQDADELIEAITKVVFENAALDSAIAEYEGAMIPRGAKEVELSLQTAHMSIGEGMAEDFKWRYSYDQNVDMNAKGHIERR